MITTLLLLFFTSAFADTNSLDLNHKFSIRITESQKDIIAKNYSEPKFIKNLLNLRSIDKASSCKDCYLAEREIGLLLPNVKFNLEIFDDRHYKLREFNIILVSSDVWIEFEKTDNRDFTLKLNQVTKIKNSSIDKAKTLGIDLVKKIDKKIENEFDKIKDYICGLK